MASPRGKLAKGRFGTPLTEEGKSHRFSLPRTSYIQSEHKIQGQSELPPDFPIVLP